MTFNMILSLNIKPDSYRKALPVQSSSITSNRHVTNCSTVSRALSAGITARVSEWEQIQQTCSQVLKTFGKSFQKTGGCRTSVLLVLEWHDQQSVKSVISVCPCTSGHFVFCSVSRLQPLVNIPLQTSCEHTTDDINKKHKTTYSAIAFKSCRGLLQIPPYF